MSSKQLKKLILRKLIEILKWCTATRFRRVVSSLTIVALVAGPISYIVFKPKPTSAAWWNDLWQYRKPIAMTNSSGSNLTDFQVKALSGVNLSADISAGKIKSDLGDLRFTDINGETLPYWVEDSTTSSVDAWVRMSSVPTSGATIYMYYGNPILRSPTSQDSSSGLIITKLCKEKNP